MADEGKVAGQLVYPAISGDTGGRVAGQMVYPAISSDTGGRVAGQMIYVVVLGTTLGAPNPQGNVGQGYIDADGNGVAQGDSMVTQGVLPQGGRRIR